MNSGSTIPRVFISLSFHTLIMRVPNLTLYAFSHGDQLSAPLLQQRIGPGASTVRPFLMGHLWRADAQLAISHVISM
jgi:hypothetical protein